MKSWFYRTVLLLGLSFVLVLPSMAQSIWLGEYRQRSLSVEALKPDLNGTDETFFSSALFLSGRTPLSPKFHLTADLPVSHFGFDSDIGGTDDSETGIGNPYVGLEYGEIGAPLYGEFGVRIPLASDDNAGLVSGMSSDLDRWEAFFGDVLSFNGAANYIYQLPNSGLSVRLRGGPNLWIRTNDNETLEGLDDTELFANYSAQAWYDAGRLNLGTGVTGRAIITDDGDFGERTAHLLGFSVIGDFHKVRPGLHFRLPIDDDLNDVMDYAVGLSVTVPVR